MKKIITVCLCAALIVLCFAGCKKSPSDTVDLTSDTTESIASTPADNMDDYYTGGVTESLDEVDSGSGEVSAPEGGEIVTSSEETPQIIDEEPQQILDPTN